MNDSIQKKIFVIVFVFPTSLNQNPSVENPYIPALSYCHISLLAGIYDSNSLWATINGVHL